METPTTADIGMRLLVPVPDDETAGKLMDAVQTAVDVVLGHYELTGRLEIVHFNLRPCKAARLDGHARDVSDEDVRLGAGREASARRNPAPDGTKERA
jgi:hypothetical protein